jgi:hypothetical protein
VKLTIPDVPPSLNVSRNLHWAAKARLRDNWILLIRSQLKGRYLKPIVKMRCLVTLCHARPYDSDNAYGACKPLVDALKHWKLIYDDNGDYLDLTVWQSKCPHKKRHTIIELEAM